MTRDDLHYRQARDAGLKLSESDRLHLAADLVLSVDDGRTLGLVFRFYSRFIAFVIDAFRKAAFGREEDE